MSISNHIIVRNGGGGGGGFHIHTSVKMPTQSESTVVLST